MVEQISANNFKQTLQDNKVVVVDFFAQWCGPCRMMHPVVEELSNQYKHIKFVKLDIDNATGLAVSQNVQVVPTFIAYKNGAEVNRIIGYNSSEDFALFLQSIQN